MEAWRLAAICAALGAASLGLQGCGGGGGGSGGGGGGGDDPGHDDKPPADIVEQEFRSISYGPLYLANQDCRETFSPQCAVGFLTDDIAAPWAAPLWSDSGRGDLANAQSLGANAIRLYGNDPRFDKTEFLDDARSRGIRVVEGLSSYWYNGNGGPMCALKNAADCHDPVREAYALHLHNGFMKGEEYHKALAVVNIMNEPDFLGEHDGTITYLKAMVTAMDGILTAEKQCGVKPWKNGRLPRLTISWSFAVAASGKHVCDEAHFIKNPATECGPGIIFMVQFYRVLHDPVGTVGYHPKNDLAQAYKDRWIHSFNTFVDAEQVLGQFITPYTALDMFKGIHVYCGEWHPPHLDGEPLQANLEKLLSFNKNNETSMFLGVSFFQYQVAYNKGGPERDFGLFKLGEKIIGSTGYITDDSAPSHPVNCLEPTSKVEWIAKAWNGSMPTHGMCSNEGRQHVLV